MYNIVIGRNEADLKKFGEEGTILLGKHYVTMGKEKSLANPVLLDVNKPHVILVSGKRGSGKSYTLSVIAEGISLLKKEIFENISCLIFDTMGIFWTMKYPNYRDEELLEKWNLKPEGLKVRVFIPARLFEEYKSKGIPADSKFSIGISQLTPEDWCALFKLELNSSPGILIERVILDLKEKKKNFSVEDVIGAIKKDERAGEEDKNLVIARFEAVEKWGIFEVKGTKFDELVRGGQISILDLSAYSQMPEGDLIKNLVIGFISSQILKQRLVARKIEEVEEIKELLSKKEQKEPLVWILIDEAHEFVPKDEVTLATNPLRLLLKEGRQPGVSLVLATQQPGKIHSDALSQADIIISHRLTAKEDVNALNEIMQSYLPFAIQKYIDNLPREKGTAIILDDNSEKIYPMRVRPKLSWHGGEDPSAIRKIGRGKKLDLGI